MYSYTKGAVKSLHTALKRVYGLVLFLVVVLCGVEARGVCDGVGDGDDSGSIAGGKSSGGGIRDSVRLLAFPTAEGYGRYAVGGRGGRVFVVRNLEDGGPGSLREAVEAVGCRTVVFGVCGTIALRSPLRIEHDSITIAGQSAPGGGICLKDYPLIVNASEVVVRYIRVRVGDRYPHDSDGVGGGRYGQRNVILDHLSVSWSIDECLSIYKTENLTVQWCLVSHSLNGSVHSKGSHGFGGIWGGYKATFHHNLLANHASRNPRFSSVDGTKWVDCRNNVIYNWGYKSAYGGGHHGEINLVGCYYKPGPASEHHRLLDVAEDGTGRYYVWGNVMAGDSAVTHDNRLGVRDLPGRIYVPDARQLRQRRGINPAAVPSEGEVCGSCLVDEPFPFEPIREDTPEEAYRRVSALVGCSRCRDSYDAEVIRQMLAGEGSWGKNGIIDTQEEVGGWPELGGEFAAGTGVGAVGSLFDGAGDARSALEGVGDAGSFVDSDGDGIPDGWELMHGLDPSDAGDGSSCSLDSLYTNLEVYLNSLVAEGREK